MADTNGWLNVISAAFSTKALNGLTEAPTDAGKRLVSR
jgi:hypothetical protein